MKKQNRTRSLLGTVTYVAGIVLALVGSLTWLFKETGSLPFGSLWLRTGLFRTTP